MKEYILTFQDPVKRILGLTETCLIERDPQTYSIVTLRPLSSVSNTTFFIKHFKFILSFPP